MSNHESQRLAEKLAKEKYGDNWLAGLWGSAAVLLSEKDFKIIISVMEK